MENNKLIAHNQDELDEILSEDKCRYNDENTIYLDGNFFYIRNGVSGKKFIGIGDSPVSVTVYSDEFIGLPNVFENIKYDELYSKRITLLQKAANVEKNSLKVTFYKELAETGNIDGMLEVAKCYEDGIGVKKDIYIAEKYYQQAVELGSARAMCYLANLYEYKFDDYLLKAVELYQKSADLGYDLAKKKIDDIKKFKGGII